MEKNKLYNCPFPFQTLSFFLFSCTGALIYLKTPFWSGLVEDLKKLNVKKIMPSRTTHFIELPDSAFFRAVRNNSLYYIVFYYALLY